MKHSSSLQHARALIRLTVVLGAILVAPRASAEKAYVLIGNADDALGYNAQAAQSAASEAVSDYDDAGYDTLLDTSATRQDLINALNDPETCAIWVFCHGAYCSKEGALGKEKLTEPKQGLKMTDGWVLGTQVPGPFPHIKSVTLHACGQDLQSWRDKFPTAVNRNEFDAWSGTTNGCYIWWWQWGAEYKNVNDPNFGINPPRPHLHTRFEETGQFSFDPPDAIFYYHMGPVSASTPEFTLHPGLAAALSGRRFNFLTNVGMASVNLVSATISGNLLDPASQDIAYDPNADFDVIVEWGTIAELLEDPDLWHAYKGDPMRVAWVDGSGGAVSEADALEGVGVVLFGNALSGCPVTVYCDGNPDNSADITIDTCSCAATSIEIGMTGAVAPDGNFGYVLIGGSSGIATDPPGALGDLCLIGGPVGRYSQPADVRAITGGSARPLDILNAASGGGGGGIPTIGGNVCAPVGQTWNFQWWYRNGMNPSRFSKALAVTFHG